MANVESDILKIDYGTGDVPTALARVSRAIILMVHQAITQLTDLGWDRMKHRINIVSDPDEPLPTYVTLLGKNVFEIVVTITTDNSIPISVEGRWIKKPGRPSFIRKLSEFFYS